MPTDSGSPHCQAVLPSAPAELAWVLDLVLGSANYSAPALAELDATLLPGVAAERTPLNQAFARLWGDDLHGCPELIPAAAVLGALLEPQPDALLAGLDNLGSAGLEKLELVSESPAQRIGVNGRLRRLAADEAARQRYRELITQLWELLRTPWQGTGLAAVRRACLHWEGRIATGVPIEELVPPRHPLARAEQLGLESFLASMTVYVLSPLYFCTSGGHVVDVGRYAHIGVPASALLPSRRALDAGFVATRLRVLADPTRLRLLIQLLGGPAGVMELARALALPQATVSGHLKALSEAGLLVTRRRGARRLYSASLRNIERLLEESRATLARWA